MTPDRFRTIVEAYGAEPRRWPAAERGAAQAWADAHRAEAAAILAAAAPLDAWLAQDAAAAPDAALFERIVASAPAAVASLPAAVASGPVAVASAPATPLPAGTARAGRNWRRGRVWWSSVVCAGVGLAGGYAGALAVSLSMVTTTLPQGHEEPWLTTGFGSPVADWSEE
ncbi:hypothetical protein [Bordetella sp. N]|uniref:hypothetical protein n=1 Tax=Bordetella sp. N TaxID=1746199 RepID=UPI00070AA024|nr:hypothetical protein [Bordetella sp. N]ALM86190.1 hypothetical protein ASB57_27455 [Bordetella sp. N]